MSFNDIVADSWNLLRMASGAMSSGPPVSILDHALSDDPLDILRLDDLFSLPHGAMSWEGPVPAVPEPPPPASEPEEAPPSALSAPRLQARSNRLTPSAEDTLSRRKALDTWLAIIEAMGPAFKLTPCAEGVDEATWLEDYLARKATGTLLTRASAWTLFLRHATAKGLDPTKLDEQAAFDYLSHLQATGAPPSRGDNFLRAAHFAFGCLCFSRGHGIATSSRCQGKSAMSLAEKRLLRQRDPLKAAWLRSAEAEVARASFPDGEARSLDDVEATV
jgi:hypothetical protein